MRLLGHTASLGSTLWQMAKLFSRYTLEWLILYCFAFPPLTYESFGGSAFSLTAAINQTFLFFILATIVGVLWNLSVVSLYISIMTSNVVRCLTYSMAICMSSLVKCPYLCDFLIRLLSYCWFRGVCYTFFIQFIFQIYNFQTCL